MKPSRDDIVEEIITHLGRPDRPEVRDFVELRLNAYLTLCAMPFRDATTISKLAKRLEDALPPWGDNTPMFLDGCDRSMSVRELRFALRWLQSLRIDRAGPSRKIDRAKIYAAHTAASLSRGASLRGRGQRYEALRAIADLLYYAHCGKQVSLKRSVDRVVREQDPRLGY
jgi:hypothetical protein